MKECCEEGALRAYLDRELPPEEMAHIAVHLGGCMECHARYNELAGRAARVASLMGSLTLAAPVAQPVVRPWPVRKPAAAFAVAALAAALAAGFVLLPKRQEAPKPVAAPHLVPVHPAMVQAEAPPVEKPEHSTPRAKAPKRVKPPRTDYYLALDNEPLDTGVVMRVALDDTGVQADVIFDAQGRPRAIRAIK